MNILDPPNILKCKNCDEEIALTQVRVTKGVRCEKCDGPMTVRCGAGPRKEREHSCRFPVKVGNRCKRHGGASLKGANSPAFRTGNHSKFVPERYAEAFQAALNDPLAQTEQRNQLAMMEALAGEALQRLGTAESGAAWARLQALGSQIETRLRNIAAAGSRGDSQRAARLANDLLTFLKNELLPTIENGVGEEAARTELQDIYLKRSRLIRVQQHGEKTVPIEVLGVMQQRFLSLMTKYVQDPKDLTMLVAELREAELPGHAVAVPPKETKVVNPPAG